MRSRAGAKNFKCDAVVSSMALNYVCKVFLWLAIAAPCIATAAAFERADHGAATHNLFQLAETGHADAQYELGALYDSGEGVPQDVETAAKLYSAAAEQGHARAQFRLGTLYTIGLDIPQDYVQAYKWLKLAAERLPVADADGRNSATRICNSIAAIMTPAQIAEAQELVRQWKPK
jgi:uncharacterized protein